MRIPRLLVALLVLAGFFARPGTAQAGAVVEVQGTDEVSGPGGEGRMLLLYGQNLTKVTAFSLEKTDGTPIAPLTVAFRSKTLAAVVLPATLDHPAFELPGDFSLKFDTKTSTASVVVRLTMGHAEVGGVRASSIEEALREDLDHAATADDAATVGGETPAEIHDAARLTGTVAAGRFSAYDDLVAESRVGSGFAQVAAGNHEHDARYPLRGELDSPGTINSPGNPVHWSQLVGVPSGLADGVDDGGLGAGLYLAGDGLSLNEGVFAVRFGTVGTTLLAARSDHNHDAVYPAKDQLSAGGGTINAPANPVDWSRLKGVPADFADGRDDDSQYTPGKGLGMAWNTFYVLFQGSGSADTVARSDHAHSNYLEIGGGGGGITSTMNFNTSGDAIVASTGNTSNPGSGSYGGGIDATSSSGTGLAGHGNVGVLGDLDGDGYYAVWGKADYSSQTAVRADSSGKYATAVQAYATGAYSAALRAYATASGGQAIVASTSANYSTTMGIYGAYRGTAARVYAGRYGTGLSAYSYRGTAIEARVYGYATTGLRVQGNYTRNMAVFQRYGYNVIRFSSRGTGYFNGGTYSWGADFAESVKVDAEVEEFEPGDVLVIDADAVRQFSISTEANSPLVAGVVSTRPAMVGTVHDMARGPNSKMRKEEVKLGIVGIVPTKVCDEGGPIRAGDMLVSASIRGHAKKAPAQPAVGTVIGKALGSLESGKGRIEVLLMAR